MNESDTPKPLDEVLGTATGIYKPAAKEGKQQGDRPVELGGPKGPEPTRYGDWEKKGRCIDF